MVNDEIIGAIFVAIGIFLFIFFDNASTMLQKGFMRHYNAEYSDGWCAVMILGMVLFALGLGFYFFFVGL